MSAFDNLCVMENELQAAMTNPLLCGLKKGMSDYLECSARPWHTCCPLSPERKIRHFRKRQLRTKYITRRGGGRTKDEMGQIRYSLRLLVVDALPPRRRAA